MEALMKICLMDMDDRTKRSMVLVLSHRADDSMTLTEDVSEADIAVLDMDHDGAPQAFQAVHACQPGLRAIGLTANPGQPQEGVLIIRKPISAIRLLEAIQKLASGETQAEKILAADAASALGARAGSIKRRSTTTTPTAQGGQFFDMGAYLLGTILDAAAEAGKRDAVAVISFYGDRIVLADNKSGLIRTNLSSSQARAFAISSLEADTDVSATVGLQRPRVAYITQAEANARYRDKTYSVPQEIFMWSLGAMTSRGRLPVGTRTDERVYLRRWPNMTRFSHSDNDLRIVAYWVQQATSLEEIADALGVPEAEVFNVYTAAVAAGLAGKARREVDEVWAAPEVTEHKERGLFSSILKRLLQRKPVGSDAVEEFAA